MDDETREVVDVNGTRYKLLHPLGVGGQGKVYAVEGGQFAIKLLDDVERTDAQRSRLHQRLTEVRRLPLDDLPIARPIEMLGPPAVGYVMEMLEGMTPLSNLMLHPSGLRAKKEWYLSSGGIRRRLRLLTRCADILRQLHGKGLVYADLSPNNVLVSSSLEAEEAYLVDTDNICYQSGPGTSYVNTFRYGAPEVVMRKRGVNTLSDAYSFATIVFEILTGLHPLIGDLVNQGDPDLQNSALRGGLPWIDHPTDESNRSSHGIPRDIVLSPKLRDLADRTFRLGLNNPEERPGLSEWSDRLYAATNRTLQCPDCKNYYYESRVTCPWCGTRRPAYLLAEIRVWDPASNVMEKIAEQRPIAGWVVGNLTPTVLTTRALTGRIDQQSNKPRIEIHYDDKQKRINLRSLDERTYTLSSLDGKRMQELDDRIFPATSSWTLHLGEMGQLHRVVTFNEKASK